MIEPRVASAGVGSDTVPDGVRPPDASDMDEAPDAPLVEEERLVEDVSIDGMCGVY